MSKYGGVTFRAAGKDSMNIKCVRHHNKPDEKFKKYIRVYQGVKNSLESF